MKNYKKLVYGAVLLLILSFSAYCLIQSRNVKAAAASAYTYSANWVDRATITVTETSANGTKQTFTLKDTEWGSNNWEYKETDDLPATICKASINGFGSRQSVGFTGTGPNLGNQPWTQASSKGDLHITHRAGASCSNEDVTANDISIGQYKNATIAFTWADSQTINKVDGDSGWTMVFDPNAQPAGGGTSWFWRSSEAGESKCRDVLVVSADKTSAVLYELDASANGTSHQRAPKDIDPDPQNCYISTTVGDFQNPAAHTTGSVPSATTLGLSNVSNATAAPGTGTPIGGAAADSPDKSCEASSGGWSLAWVFCPVLEAASNLTDWLLGQFEGQLSFSVDQYGSASNPDSGAFKVHQAWAVFRGIASALVVVIMLIMIFSQAISFGPFDAYTLRKLLPKLVAAVIFIQLSWFGVVWLIELTNDLARGIANIMYFPFSGAEHMDFFSLLGNAHIGDGKLIAFNLVALGVGIFLGAAFLFTMLGLTITVLLALFAAFVTLVFRKILLLFILILAPIAFLLWILPGTERYFKMWRDNFLKALLMFPLIVALVAAGRIFAYVAGTTDSDQLISLMLILIGFFGPLFLLPRTFKWGGQAMQMAGDFANRSATKIGERPKKFMGTRQEGYSEERTRRSRERYLRGEGVNLNRNPLRLFGAASLVRRPVDLLKSGQIDPTLTGRRKETAMRRYRAAGAESEEADIKAANQEFGLLASQSEDHDDFARKVGAAQIGEEVEWKDRYGQEHKMKVTADMKRAGMNGMAKFGTDQSFRILSRILNELNHGNAEEQIMAERFRDDQVSTLKPKMDYLYRGASKVPGGSDFVPDWVFNKDTQQMELKGPITSRVSALSPAVFATMEAPDLEAMLAGLSNVANHHPEQAAKAAAADKLSTIYTHYENALANDQIRRDMGPSLNQAMLAHLNGTNLPERNDDRVKAGLTTPIEQVPTIASPTTANIINRINPDGTAH